MRQAIRRTFAKTHITQPEGSTQQTREDDKSATQHLCVYIGIHRKNAGRVCDTVTKYVYAKVTA